MEVETVTPSAAAAPDSSEGKEHLEETSSDDEKLPVLGSVQDINEGIRHILGSNDAKETNFTWEHFFVTHCGILKEDALEYERHLIAHRLSPEDTLLESLGILVQYGRIPVGDKIKISKTIQRHQEIVRGLEEDTKQAYKTLGLEGYTDVEARMIIELGGGTSEYEIDLGIDRLEMFTRELDMERLLAAPLVTDCPDAQRWRIAGATMRRKKSDRAIKLLQSFGYLTFDYTNAKSTTTPTAQTQPVSANPLLEDLLFGTAKREEDDRRAARLEMYS